MERNIHERIRDVLRAHVGKQNGITSRSIADLLNIDAGTSMITIWKLILETIHMYHMPVAGNTNAGYYIVSNRDELHAFELIY
nr:hypothetical protein [Candidatus Sigynarchaeota archaeon]